MLIYRVTNTVNSKVYIGKWSHPTVDQRWRNHKYSAKMGSPCYFHRAIRKYGPDAFRIEIIDRAKTVEELSEKEKLHIALHQSNDPKKGYNRTEGGDGMYGFKHSEASKLKNRNAHLGKKASPETRALLSELGKKAIFSAERKENIRLSKLGNKRPPLSLSWKSKISLALRGRKGRKASEAWKQWKSGHSKEFWADPVYRAKQTQSHKEWWTPERRKIWALQMRNTKHHLGKKHSEQQRKNISDGVQRALTISPKPGKSVRCIDTGEVFPSLLHAVEKFGGYGSNLSRSIRKGYKFFGRQFEYAG